VRSLGTRWRKNRGSNGELAREFPPKKNVKKGGRTGQRTAHELPRTAPLGVGEEKLLGQRNLQDLNLAKLLAFPYGYLRQMGW